MTTTPTARKVWMGARRSSTRQEMLDADVRTLAGFLTIEEAARVRHRSRPALERRPR